MDRIHEPAASPRFTTCAGTPGDAWPEDDPTTPEPPPELDDETPLELDDDEFWQAIAPDDDYEPVPEPGDFWTEFDVA